MTSTNTPAHVALVHRGAVVYAVRFFGGDGTHEGNVRASGSREKAFAAVADMAERLGGWPTAAAAFPDDVEATAAVYARVQARRAR